MANVELSINNLVPVYRKLDDRNDYRKLYKDANEFIMNPSNRKLVELILSTKNEDDVSKWAYTNHISKVNYIPLLFCCLKKYRLTIESTGESTPFENVWLYKPGIKSKNIDSYPAYIHLVNTLTDLLVTNVDNIKILNDCLYSDPSILFEGYIRNAYVDANITINELYNCLYQLLCRNGNTRDIYNILQIIGNIKLSTTITEKDIGYRMLFYQPNDFQSQFKSWYDDQYNAIHTKHRIALFFNLIEVYQSLKGNKTTPTGKQYFTYCDQKRLDIAWPDTFNGLIYDSDYYAFEEFTLLRNQIIELMLLDRQSLEKKVNQIYI